MSKEAVILHVIVFNNDLLVCSVLINENISDSNPAGKITLPKLPKNQPLYLSVNEIKRIFDGIDLNKKHALRDLAIIKVLYGSGLRVSELLDLKLIDIQPTSHNQRNTSRDIRKALQTYCEKGNYTIMKNKFLNIKINKLETIINNFGYILENMRGVNYEEIVREKKQRTYNINLCDLDLE